MNELEELLFGPIEEGCCTLCRTPFRLELKEIKALGVVTPEYLESNKDNHLCLTCYNNYK